MIHSTVSRRQMLTLCGSVTLGGTSLLHAEETKPMQSLRILETKTISYQPYLYCGWPTVTRRSNGELIVVWSGGRGGHVCPFGRVEMMRSRDEGKSWTWPRVLIDSAIDDRDAGVLETDKGTLLVTTFTSLAYVSQMSKVTGESRIQWQAVHNRLSDQERQNQLGTWMLRSTDSGVSWSARYRVPVNSPHGPIQASKGRLLYAGKELWHGKKRVGVCESVDDGQTWNWLSTIPPRKGDDPNEYHELHAVATNKGKIVVHVRNHNRTNSRETLQTISEDGGKTWSELRPIGVWGLPSHLLRLHDGRLLMSYSYRRKPFGNQVRLSTDEGATWSDPLIVSADGDNYDLGYPSTVQLNETTFLTVWYEKRKAQPKAVLRQAKWVLEDQAS